MVLAPTLRTFGHFRGLSHTLPCLVQGVRATWPRQARPRWQVNTWGGGGGERKSSLPRGSHHCQIPFLESAPAFPVLLPVQLPEQCLSSLGESQLAVSMNSQITFLSSLGRGGGTEGGAGINNPIFCHPLPPHSRHHPGSGALAG